MAATNQTFADFLASNPGMSDATIAEAMQKQNVTPEQVAQITGLDLGSVQSRFNAVQPAADTTTAVAPLGSQGIAAASPDLAQVNATTGTTPAPGALAQTTAQTSNVSGLTGLAEDDYSLGYVGPDYGGAGDYETRNATRVAGERKAIQDLYTEFMGSGRGYDPEGIDYWYERFGPEIDASEREQFRQAVVTDLTGAFKEGDAGLLGGFQYARNLGIDDAGLKSALGDDLYGQYRGQLQNFATNEINSFVSDDSLSFEESQRVAQFARDLGYDSQQLANLTGKNRFLYDTILASYDTNSRKIINDTLSGPGILTDADRVVAAYALEKRFGFTDDELSRATGVDIKTIKDSLNPVRNFETDFSKIANNTDSTTQQIKDFVANAQSNAAVNKLYGEALTGYSNKIAELENKWGRYGTDAVQSENLFQQLNAQRNALGGQYFQGVFGDLETSAARLVRLGLDTMGDLGRKDKYQTQTADRMGVKGPNGESVYPTEDGRYFMYDSNGTAKYFNPDQVTPVYGQYDWEAGGYVPISAEEAATLKADGSFQRKIGSVVIDKDTGREITDITGQLAHQKSGGHLTGRNHWLNAHFTADGTPYLTATTEKSGFYGFVSDIGPMALSLASFIPGPWQPFAMAANAALAASQKNYLGAVLGALGAYGTFTGGELTALNAAEASGDIINASKVLDLQNTASNIKLAQTAISGVAALNQENLSGIINAGLSAYGQTGGTLPSGVTTAMQLGNFTLALKNENIAGALVALGDLTGSKDMYVAAGAKNLVDAFQTGDMSNILQAGLVFGNSIEAANKARTTTGSATTTTGTGDAGGATGAGGITNRVVDDATTGVLDPSGSAAFVAAKNAGATDAEALAAANAVTGAATGVQVNAIGAGGPNLSTVTTYSGDANTVDTNWGNLDEAVEGQGRTTQIQRLVTDFEKYTGRTFDKVSENEAVALGIAMRDLPFNQLQKLSVQDLINRTPTIVGKDDRGRWLDSEGYSYDDKGFKYAPGSNMPTLEVRGVGSTGEDTGPGVAANIADSIVENITGLDGTTGKIVQQGLSTILGLVGEQVADLSSSFGNMGLLSRNNAGVTAGKYLEDIAKRLQLPETQLALDNWVSAVDKEPTYLGKIAAGVKGVFQNPLVLTEVVKEIGQEVLPGALALKVAKYAGIAAGAASSTLLNSLESAGSTGRQIYAEEIAKGTPPAEAARIADRKAGYAGLITMATSGITDAAIAKKYGAAIEDYLGRKASSTGGEFAQESFEEGLIALATGKTPAEAMTQSVVGGLVGGKTSGTMQTASDIQADFAASFAAQGLTSTDGSFRAETIVPLDTTAGTTLGAGAVDTTLGAGAVDTTLGAGNVETALGAGNVETAGTTGTTLGAGAVDATLGAGAVGTAGSTLGAENVSTVVTNAVNSGGDVTGAVNTAVSGTITNVTNNGGDVTGAVETAVGAAVATVVNTGGDVTGAVETAVGAAVTNVTNNGGDVTGAVEAAVGAAVTNVTNNGGDVTGAVEAAVGAAVTNVTNNGGDVTGAVEAAVGAAVTNVTNNGGDVTGAVETAVGAAVTNVTNNGGDVTGAVETAVGAAVTNVTNNGGDVTGAVEAAVGAAVTNVTNNGGDVTGAVEAAVGAAVESAVTNVTNTGGDVTGVVETVVGAAVTGVVNSGGDVDAAVAAAVGATVVTGGNTGDVGTVVTAAVDAAVGAAVNAGNDITVESDADTTIISNATTGATITVDNNTGATTVVNSDANLNTDLKTDPKVGTGVVVGEPAGTDSTVIDSDTIDLGDGVVIDITTGEQLTPEEIADRKKRSKTQVPKLAKKPSGMLVGASGATPPYKPSDISETWLGGQFRNLAPLVAFAGLLPENNPMFQEQQALSALRRASGLGGEPEKPQSDYFSYGSEPSVASVLAPYKRGGGVQDPTGGGKIMTSPLMAASGGDVEHKGSHYVQGAGGGQDDLIPAKLADGEYVFDAEIVAALGDGSNKEGARKLDEFREAIRQHKRSGSIKTIPPKAKSPLAYMKGIK